MHHFGLLQKIGLSKTACAAYEMLCSEGPTTADGVAERLKLNRKGIYRVLGSLNEQGFIQAIKPYGHPTQYRAYPVNTALNNYFAYQKRLVRPLAAQFPSEASRDLQMHNKLEKQIEAAKRLTPAQVRVGQLFRGA